MNGATLAIVCLLAIVAGHFCGDGYWFGVVYGASATIGVLCAFSGGVH